jgi:hypothetical protein
MLTRDAPVRGALLAALLLASSSTVAAAQETSSLEERLQPSGLEVDEVRQLLGRLKQAFAAEGCTDIAALVSYPYVLPGSPDLGITTGDGEPAGPKVDTPDEFIKRCQTLVTPKVRKAVRDQKADDLFANWRGVMIGRGEVWFGGICADAECTSHQVRIIRINAGP